VTNPTDAEIEAVARAYDPVGWTWYDSAGLDHPAKAMFYVDKTSRARAAILALDKVRNP